MLANQGLTRWLLCSFTCFTLCSSAEASTTSILALVGDPAPWVSGASYGTFISSTCAVSGAPSISYVSGHVMIPACLNGQGINWSNNGRIIYRVDPELNFDIAARTQNEIPEMEDHIYSLQQATLGAEGDIVFWGTILGPTASYTNDFAYFYLDVDEQDPFIILREGDQAFESVGVNYSSFSNVQGPMVLDENSIMLFDTQLVGSGINGSNNLACGKLNISTTETSSTLQIQKGDYAPDESDGARILSLQRYPSPGVVSVFGVSLYGANVLASNNHGLLKHQGESISKIVRAGDLVPSLPGITFASIVYSGSVAVLPAVNKSGKVVFQAALGGASINYFNDYSIWTDRNDQLELLFREGDPLPEHGPNTFIYNLQNVPYWIDDDGNVIVRAEIRQGQSNYSHALLRKDVAGTTHIIAVGGEDVPDHSDLQFAPNSLANTLVSSKAAGNGSMLFTAHLVGSGITTTNDSAVFRLHHGEITLIAREGDIVDARSIVGFATDKMHINESGQCVVPVILSQTSAPGLVTCDSNGQTNYLATPGGYISLNNGDSVQLPSSTSYALSIGPKNALSHDGKVVFATRIMDGSTPKEAILLHQIVDSGGTGCPADYDRNGSLETQDIFAFLEEFFGGSADFDNNGVTDPNDIFAFLTAYFAGCS